MLRWIVLLVLLSNIFAAFWFYSLKEFRVKPASTDSAVTAIPGIFLLSELSDVFLRQNNTCVLHGLFSSMQKAQSIQIALKRLGSHAILVAKDTTGGADYWVYIPVDSLGGDPVRILQELKANNINSFVFGQGELEGAISISVFNAADDAQEQAKRLKRLGYDGEIHEMPRLIRQYWLGLSEKELANAADFDWEIRAGQKITTRKVEMPCERVASPPEFP